MKANKNKTIIPSNNIYSKKGRGNKPDTVPDLDLKKLNQPHKISPLRKKSAKRSPRYAKNNDVKKVLNMDNQVSLQKVNVDSSS